jgi:perosamine synthetase
MVPHRDAVMGRLKQLGIETRACYPVPLYRQPIFASIGTADCPVTEAACAGILNPPMFHGLTADQQGRVVRTLTDVIEELSTVRLRKAI